MNLEKNMRGKREVTRGLEVELYSCLREKAEQFLIEGRAKSSRKRNLILVCGGIFITLGYCFTLRSLRLVPEKSW